MWSWLSPLIMAFSLDPRYIFIAEDYKNENNAPHSQKSGKIGSIFAVFFSCGGRLFFHVQLYMIRKKNHPSQQKNTAKS
jgi:hypothetical protein